MLSGRTRYPSPLIKQDLARLGKDPESRRLALASLRCVVEEHLSSSTSLARFLQQIEDSRDGRRHVALILQDLAKSHGPSLVPHLPRLLHLLVQALLTAAESPALLASCASAVSALANHCACPEEKNGPGTVEEEEVLRQICLPLVGLLPNKIPPLSTGAATCLRVLVESETWKLANPSLVDDMCWKAAMAAASPPTQTVSHIMLLRSLAKTNASAMSRFAPPLLRLSLDILLKPAVSMSWQHRLAAVHLLESLLKAADHTVLSTHLRPAISALTKCRRHDKLPQVRAVVLQALRTAQSLHVIHNPDGEIQQEENENGTQNTIKSLNHWRNLSDTFSDQGLPWTSEISPSPLTSPRRLNVPLSARAALPTSALNQIPCHQMDPDNSIFLSYFQDAEEAPHCSKFVHRVPENLPFHVPSAFSPARPPSRKPSPLRHTSLMNSPASRKTSATPKITSPIRKRLQETVIIPNNLCTPRRGAVTHKTCPSVEVDEEKREVNPVQVPHHALNQCTRDIAVLDSNESLLQTCEKNNSTNIPVRVDPWSAPATHRDEFSIKAINPVAQRDEISKVLNPVRDEEDGKDQNFIKEKLEALLGFVKWDPIEQKSVDILEQQSPATAVFELEGIDSSLHFIKSLTAGTTVQGDCKSATPNLELKNNTSVASNESICNNPISEHEKTSPGTADEQVKSETADEQVSNGTSHEQVTSETADEIVTIEPAYEVVQIETSYGQVRTETTHEQICETVDEQCSETADEQRSEIAHEQANEIADEDFAGYCANPINPTDVDDCTGYCDPIKEHEHLGSIRSTLDPIREHQPLLKAFEYTDQTDTSSGEWSVRDNPIADDHHSTNEEDNQPSEMGNWPPTPRSTQEDTRDEWTDEDGYETGKESKSHRSDTETRYSYSSYQSDHHQYELPMFAKEEATVVFHGEATIVTNCEKSQPMKVERVKVRNTFRSVLPSRKLVLLAGTPLPIVMLLLLIEHFLHHTIVPFAPPT